MKAYFDDSQNRHDPQTYFSYGAMRKPQEVPARIPPLLSAMKGLSIEVEAPRDYGTTPISAVHDMGYLRFLESAHRRWPEAWGNEVMSNIYVRTNNPMRGILAEAAAYMADGSSPLGPHTWDAAYISAQSALSAAADIASGEQFAYGICRPPGHHARPAGAGGFCFLNNSAIAAQYLRNTFDRVAIFDPDMHHGQGIQEIFWERNDVLYVSIHGDPTNFYPVVTGYEEERGAGDGYGFNLNLPMPHGSSEEFFFGKLDQALTAIRLFEADVIVLALGFDTYYEDPQAKVSVTSDGFTRMGQLLAATGKPICVIQEGGYDIDHLEINADHFFKGLLGN